MWEHYFKTSQNDVQVYGIDIDPNCKQLEDDRVKIYVGSQEDRQFLQKVKEEIGEIDILIDDGGHTMNQQITTFEELFDIVSDENFDQILIAVKNEQTAMDIRKKLREIVLDEQIIWRAPRINWWEREIDI